MLLLTRLSYFGARELETRFFLPVAERKGLINNDSRSDSALRSIEASLLSFVGMALRNTSFHLWFFQLPTAKGNEKRDTYGVKLETCSVIFRN